MPEHVHLLLNQPERGSLAQALQSLKQGVAREWSSFRHYLTGAAGAVEIESQWTGRRRERLGIFPMLKIRAPAENPCPKPALSEVERAKLERGTLERKIARGWPGHPRW